MFVSELRDRAWLLLPLASAFLAFSLIARVRTSSGRALNRCLAQAGALQWLFGILFVIGSLIG